MNKLVFFSYIAALIVAVALLPPVAGNAQSAKSRASSEMSRIMDDFEDIVLQLQYESSLNEEELSSLRRELAIIYRDLDALRERLDEYAYDPDGYYDRDTWQPYNNATREIRPVNARFKGWSRYADVSFDFRNYGEIVLRIDNYDYDVKWTIEDAYSGQVEARVNSKADGTVTLSIEDEDGEHQFMVDQGGLGKMSIRGRDGYRAPGVKRTAR